MAGGDTTNAGLTQNSLQLYFFASLRLCVKLNLVSRKGAKAQRSYVRQNLPGLRRCMRTRTKY